MNIKQNINLKDYNTFQVENLAKFFIKIKSENELINLLKTAEFKENQSFILWSWANTLFTQDFEGIIIKNEIHWIDILEETNDDITIKVGAWEERDTFVDFCLKNNYGWVENLTYIPWTVWACPVQNIWAYWCEAKDIIKEVIWINLETKKKETLNNQECKFTYRNSIFKNELKNKFIITYVIFKLKKVNKKYKINMEYKWVLDQIEKEWLSKELISIQDLARIIKEIRQSKLPDHKKIPTAWSFFQNPIVDMTTFKKLQQTNSNLVSYPIDKKKVKLAAGQLIELSWLKGIELNGAGTHKNHALVIINTWTKKWEDIINLAKYIQKTVFKKFWIQIKPEVNIL